VIGCSVSIDDFGAGYSSLSYLKELPVSILKIKQTFMQGIAEYSENNAITLANITMAHGMSMPVAAEDAGQLDVLLR
jgi:EAL domain-containing protein (putative c-di-GMP-specific phosphodiesterase class I)